MNSRQIEEIKRLNRIKSEYDHISCEIVVTKEFKKAPVSIIHGDHVGIIEMTMLYKCMEDIQENLLKDFPDIKKVLPILKKTEKGIIDLYKEIIRKEK